MSEKTEAPTPRKLQEAREQGKFPRSPLLSSALVALGVAVACGLTLPASTQKLQRWTVSAFSGRSPDVRTALLESGHLLLRFALPPLMGAWLVSLLVSVSFAGFQLRPSSLWPQWSRVSPWKGLARMFSLGRVLEIGKGLLVFTLLGLMAYSALQTELGFSLRALGSPVAVSSVLLRRVFPFFFSLVAFTCLLGGLDFLFARWKHQRELAMSREEVRDEHKQSEGDPRIKGQRRSLHRALAESGPLRGLEKASALVINPTHLSVALRYAPDECEAPYLVAKGHGEEALRMQAQARATAVPLVRDIPLARSLIHLDVGECIPEELFAAAAAVLQEAQRAAEGAVS